MSEPTSIAVLAAPGKRVVRVYGDGALVGEEVVGPGVNLAKMAMRHAKAVARAQAEVGRVLVFDGTTGERLAAWTFNRAGS